MIDLHIHSSASDGTDSPKDLLQKILDNGIKIFALTDHDTITGAVSLKKIIPPEIKFIAGIEFSCIAESGKCHILGLNYDEKNSDFQEALKIGTDFRRKKFYKRIELLREKFNINFSDDEISNLASNPSTGKPHLAKLIVQKNLAENISDAIQKYINPCKTGNDKISAVIAINAIRKSGGVPVWAHPLGGEGEKELTREKFFETLDELISYGLAGLECFYSKYTLENCKWLSEIAGQKKLSVSGGSDYHGANKNIPLGKLNAENLPVDIENFTILKNF